MNLLTDTIMVGLAVGFVITTLLTALMNPRTCRDATQVTYRITRST